MRLMTFVAAVTSLLLSPALNAQSTTATPPVDGKVYNFSAIYSGKKVIEGIVTVFADSMVVTPSSGHCVDLPFGDDVATVARFKCDEARDMENIVLAFERNAPEHGTWNGMAQRTAAMVKTVCTTGGTPTRTNTVPCPRNLPPPPMPPPSDPIPAKGKLIVTAKK